MKITNTLTSDAILSEIAERMKRHRLRKNITQQDLADEAGVGVATIARLEKGKTVQLDTLIRILRALSLLDNLDLLIPSTVATPMEILCLEKRNKRRMRARRAGLRPPVVKQVFDPETSAINSAIMKILELNKGMGSKKTEVLSETYSRVKMPESKRHKVKFVWGKDKK